MRFHIQHDPPRLPRLGDFIVTSYGRNTPPYQVLAVTGPYTTIYNPSKGHEVPLPAGDSPATTCYSLILRNVDGTYAINGVRLNHQDQIVAHYHCNSQIYIVPPPPIANPIQQPLL